MRIYACLLGEWVDITETATVADHQELKYDYIHIQYQGKDYRINPASDTWKVS